MPRPLRITVPNLPFHILDRGNNRQIVFQEDEGFVYFLKLLRRYKKELKFKGKWGQLYFSLAICVMMS